MIDFSCIKETGLLISISYRHGWTQQFQHHQIIQELEKLDLYECTKKWYFILKDLHFLWAKLPDRCNIVILLFGPRGSKCKKNKIKYPDEWAQINPLNICGQTLNKNLPFAVISRRKTNLQSIRNDKGLKQTMENWNCIFQFPAGD